MKTDGERVEEPRFSAIGLVEAFAFAAECHRNQVRKQSHGEPYVSHPMAVAAIAIEYGADLDQARAALLHDTIEDGGGHVTRAVLEARFGERVARIVADCSDCAGESPKPAWRERKERYLAHLAEASADTRLVAAADKLANARSILRDLRVLGPEVWSRFSCGAEDQLWYYRGCVDALGRGEQPGQLPDLLVALRDCVDRIEELDRELR